VGLVLNPMLRKQKFENIGQSVIILDFMLQ
jgi:hypothetical protein